MLITNFGTIASSSAGGIWLDGWTYGKEITIPATSIDSELQYFPLNVYLTSSNFDFTKAKADGTDIRFTDKYLNMLKFERKQHSSSTMAVYNVLVPTVSDLTDTEIYMWYGNANAYNTSIEAWQDMTGKALTYNGNVKIVRNSASDHYASFDGTGDYFSLADSPDFTLGSGNFCAEIFFKCNVIYSEANQMGLFGQCDSSVSATSTSIRLWYGSTGKLAFEAGVGTSTILLEPSTVTDFRDAYHHIACTRNGTNLQIFLDGVSLGTASISTSTINDSSNLFSIGKRGEQSSYNTNGLFRGFRLTKGRARYTANYTPPTTFTIDGADVVFCTNFDTIYDNNYVMVQHMGDSLVDATGNGNNGTATGTTVVNTDYGNVRDLTLTSEALTFPATSAIFDTADSTIISMVFPKNFTNRPLWYKVVTAGTDIAYHFGVRTTTGKPTLAFYSDDLDGATTLPLGDWSVVVGRHILSTKEQKVYLDGVLDGTRTATNNVSNTNNATLTYGYRATQNTTGSISRIGETRISNIARSDAWIETESLAIKNTLITINDI